MRDGEWGDGGVGDGMFYNAGHFFLFRFPLFLRFKLHD